MGGTNVTDFASIWELGGETGNGMGYCPPLDWICLPAFARFRCFLALDGVNGIGEMVCSDLGQAHVCAEIPHLLF